MHNTYTHIFKQMASILCFSMTDVSLLVDRLILGWMRRKKVKCFVRFKCRLDFLRSELFYLTTKSHL